MTISSRKSTNKTLRMLKRKIAVIWLFSSLFFSILPTALANELIGKVVSISDGDTITVLDSLQAQHKIRLSGIDAPEKKQPFGTVSKQNLANMIFGKEVTVQWEKRDRYKRIVGKVLLGRSDVNLEQVKQGLAWHYKKYQNEQPIDDRLSYLAAQEEAGKNKRGLWIEGNAIAPWDWRKVKKENSDRN